MSLSGAFEKYLRLTTALKTMQDELEVLRQTGRRERALELSTYHAHIIIPLVDALLEDRSGFVDDNKSKKLRDIKNGMENILEGRVPVF